MSFRLKTILGVALIEAVLLLILVWVSLAQLRSTGEDQLLQRAQTTAALFATTTTDAVLASDLASLESFIEEVLKNPGLVYARVRSTDQVLAEDGSTDALQKPFVADEGFDELNDGIFDTTAPITVGGESYGHVEVGLDVAHLHEQLARATKTFSGIAATELLLSALFSLALGALLTKQLHALIRGTRAVAEGRYGYQVNVEGRDEIAQAAKAFNRMSSGLADLMTENTQQRDALQSTSDLLTGLVDNLQSGVIMVDMQGKVLHANQGLLGLFHLHCAVDELKGLDHAELTRMLIKNFDNPQTAQKKFDAITALGEPQKNLLFQLSGNRFIETDYTPLLTNGVQYAHLWNHRDVTERTLARRQLQERRRQLDTVFELSPDGFVYFDGKGEVSSVNPAFCKMTGLKEERVVGIPRSHFFPVLTSQCGITDIDDSEGFRLIRTTIPKTHMLACRERSLFDDQGEHAARVIYFRDITHERELDEMKSDFLATAAHELRTPLASVFGFAELLLEFEHDEETRRDMLETIHKQSSHLVNMLNELLDLARIEARAGKDFEITRQPLLPIVQDVVDGYLPEDDDRSLIVDLPDTLATVPVDETKFKQLLGNILNNAFKYSPDGGDISMQAASKENTIDIIVHDEGIGMTEDQIESIFDRFYRADKSGNIPGSGLGMSLVKEIVNIHGWDIEIESTMGKGTAVTIRIPLDNAAINGMRKAG